MWKFVTNANMGSPKSIDKRMMMYKYDNEPALHSQLFESYHPRHQSNLISILRLARISH